MVDEIGADYEGEIIAGEDLMEIRVLASSVTGCLSIFK
jgi:hypothetical protein